MKKFFAFSLLSIAALYVQAQTPAGNNATKVTTEGAVVAAPADSLPPTKIQFEKMDHDFGDINQGDRVRYTYKFKNVGSNPLVLENVKPTCGCTAPSWPKEPIAPGASGEIEIEFNSFGKSGPQTKYVTITYNGEPRMERISFKANILVPTPPPGTDAPANGTVVAPGNVTGAPATASPAPAAASPAPVAKPATTPAPAASGVAAQPAAVSETAEPAAAKTRKNKTKKTKTTGSATK